MLFVISPYSYNGLDYDITEYLKEILLLCGRNTLTLVLDSTMLRSVILCCN